MTHTHALFADQSQSILDNLLALLGQSSVWNCSDPERSDLQYEWARGRMKRGPGNVRYPGQYGEYILTQSFTARDPKPTSDVSAMSDRALANEHPDRSSCRLTRNYSPQTLINLHRCVQPEGSSMDLQMNGKTALVIGGSAGIG